ncbi:MAG TPA: hypothetical protein VMV03_16840 [Spirochaetia bacterium]|nr:hypothetical protein [Spirochaetia bacterium]
MPRFPAVLCLAVALTACSSSQTFVIRGDGSGTMTLHVEVSRLLHDYIVSLGEVSGTSAAPSGDRIFDQEAIRKGFEAQPGVSVDSLSSPGPSVLDASLSFLSLSAIFAGTAGLGASQAVVLSESEGVKTLKIHLDRANYRQVAALFPLLQAPVLQSLGPQVNEKVSNEDYLEMVRFAIGDDGPALVRKSFIVITIRPEGEIVSQSGGTPASGAVVFRVPLLRLLVLDSPLDFSVSFR